MLGVKWITTNNLNRIMGRINLKKSQMGVIKLSFFFIISYFILNQNYLINIIDSFSKNALIRNVIIFVLYMGFMGLSH